MNDRFQVTSRLRRHVERHARFPTAWLSEQTALSDKKVRSILDRYFQRRMFAHRDAPLRIISIDDITLRNGVHTVFVDGETGQLITLVRGKDSGTVANVLRTLNGTGTIRAITMDGADGYRLAVQRAGLSAPIVLDKWHLLKRADDAFWDFFQMAFEKVGPVERTAFEQVRRILRSKPSRRSAEEVWLLRDWWLRHDDIASCYLTRVSFYSIWRSCDRESAAQALRLWMAQIPDPELPYFQKLQGHLRDWREQFLNYFPPEKKSQSRESWSYRITNARAENVNGMIRKLDRQGRGYSEPRLLARAMFKKSEEDTDWLQCWNCRRWFSPRTTSYEVASYWHDAAHGVSDIRKTYAFHAACLTSSCEADFEQGNDVMALAATGIRPHRQISLALAPAPDRARPRQLTWYGELGEPDADEDDYHVPPETLSRLGIRLD